ncbi:MAG: 5'/3'-nucleotidase SurE [Clostridiales bacterium]|nr:5'/3'-nucleotidase SurE [Clostridiales bacterium]
MRILFTNDDGYDSEGLHAVACLFKDEYEIAVVAPIAQKSGFSHSLTLGPQVLCAKKIDGYDYDVYAVDGTPVDCVKFARNCVFKKPDVVVSGINNGQNLGSDIMYSGTVSAAVDAAHSGLRAFALSLLTSKDTVADFKDFARFFKNNFKKFMSIELPPKSLININYPNAVPIGIKTVRMNTQETFIDSYDKTADGVYLPSGYRDYTNLDRDTDEWYCRNGYITVTPLVIDRTDYKTLDEMRGTEFEL